VPAPEATASAEPSPAEPEPEEEEPPPAPLVATRLGLELAPAVVFSPGGLGPALDGWLGLRLRLGRYLSLSGFALVPFWSGLFHGDEGSVRILTLIPGGTADFELNHRRWQFRVGAGAGGVITFMSGTGTGSTPQMDWHGSHDVVTTSALLARATLRYALGYSGWGVYLATSIGTTVPVVSIRFKTLDQKTHEFGRWGGPFVVTSLGVEVPLLLEPP
jgi:hypothetical protein